MDLDKLEQLEFRVERLLELHQRLKRAKAQAETRLEEREIQFKSLNDRLQRYERERDALRERLTRLIGELEDLDLC